MAKFSKEFSDGTFRKMLARLTLRKFPGRTSFQREECASSAPSTGLSNDRHKVWNKSTTTPMSKLQENK